MSRSYRMYIDIEGFDKKNEDAIIEALEDLWVLEHCDCNDNVAHITCGGESCLTGGCSEQEFADELAKAVFKANGRVCNIEIQATFMEDLPCEYYSFDKDDKRAKEILKEIAEEDTS